VLSIAELISEADALARAPRQTFNIMVPFVAVPASSGAMPSQWNNPTSVSAWMHTNGFADHVVRQHGGFLFEVAGRDVWAAVERAFEIVEKLAARVALGTSGSLRPLGDALVLGWKPFPFRREPRGVDIGALARTNQLYTETPMSRVDAAIELLAELKNGAPARAVAGGWAALEALLVTEGGEKGVAAERLGDLVACSFARAELTTIAHAYEKRNADQLATDLAVCGSNRERALRLSNELINNATLATGSTSDDAALARLRVILARPRDSRLPPIPAMLCGASIANATSCFTAERPRPSPCAPRCAPRPPWLAPASIDLFTHGSKAAFSRACWPRRPRFS